jgi:peptidyl-prolyl cis-trans isomerase D
MATLEKIRSKGGVLAAIFIGFALFAFIMMDMMSSGSSLFSGSRMEVANINGQSVNIQEFQNKVTEIEEFNKLNQGKSSLTEEQVNTLRDQVWNQMITQTLLQEIYEELGLTISSQELKDMVSGNNIHPVIQQHPLFRNQETGVFDKQQVLNFLMSKAKDPTANFYWSVMEDQIIKDQLFTKYKALLRKGMYTPSAWVESEMASRSKTIDFDFIGARFNTVSDSLVTASDDEIANYYKGHQTLFKQTASRSIEYITFDVTPTDGDRESALKWVNDMMTNFTKLDIDPIQFVNLNSDEQFNERNYRPAELSSELAGFVTNAKVGDVYGPYLENEAYKATRLVAINELPDSVRARHILIQGASMEAANKEADSLMTLIKNGADFAELARNYSKDQGSAVNGGDLDWFREGMMIKPLNDAAFQGKKGDIVKVESQYGVHIIEIQDKNLPSTKYQIAVLARNITYSSQTYQNIYTEATRFASQNNTVEKFNAAIAENKITKRYARSIKENDRNVNKLESPRELVKWTFESPTDALSPVYEFGDQFVIAHLVSITEEGVMPLKTVEARIKRELLNDKKATYLIAQFNDKLAGNADFATIATQMKSTVQTASNITFASYQVPGAGVEPALVALAVNTSANKISKPVKGSNGVYVVKVNSITDNQPNAENVKMELAQGSTMKVDYQLIETLTNRSEIVDRRSQFY